MIKNNLFVQAISKFLLGVILIGLLLFLPAGSLQYWQGWLLMGILFVPKFLRENTYLSRTIEMQENQKVIDTGLYGIVRHPMYMATTVLFLAMPLVLASPFSFLIMLLYIPLIARRIKNEEKVLEEGLDGYNEYMQKVRYKVIPFIW